MFKNIFIQTEKNEKLQHYNWVDKCDYIIENYKKYKRIYLIFDNESLMLFCNYYLLDGFNEIGYNKINIQTIPKEKTLVYMINRTIIWVKTTNQKLKMDLVKNILPLHFTVFDFSSNLINILNNDLKFKNRGKKNQGVKKIYGIFKGSVNHVTRNKSTI